jgi:hypothetical protein
MKASLALKFDPFYTPLFFRLSLSLSLHNCHHSRLSDPNPSPDSGIANFLRGDSASLRLLIGGLAGSLRCAVT